LTGEDLVDLISDEISGAGVVDPRRVAAKVLDALRQAGMLADQERAAITAWLRSPRRSRPSRLSMNDAIELAGLIQRGEHRG